MHSLICPSEKRDWSLIVADVFEKRVFIEQHSTEKHTIVSVHKHIHSHRHHVLPSTNDHCCCADASKLPRQILSTRNILFGFVSLSAPHLMLGSNTIQRWAMARLVGQYERHRRDRQQWEWSARTCHAFSDAIQESIPQWLPFWQRRSPKEISRWIS